MNSNRSRKSRLWMVSFGAIVVVLVGLGFVFDFFPEEEKELRRGFRTAVKKTFPQQAAKVKETFGLTHFGEPSESSSKPHSDKPSVVLIHGLDDPGKIWMNLAPTLVDNDMDVWEMRYPNDQPIEDSAHFFHDKIKPLTLLGIYRIAIIAHSMGGLVAREMLTNPQIAYNDKVHSGEVPTVVGLIMVGTPNHGSELARLRIFTEIRDQWTHMVQGQGNVLRSVLDGAGEAKIDLLPGSQFLETLNKRPQPEGVHLLVIAGAASPWDEKDIKRLFNSTLENTPVAKRKMLVDLETFLKSMIDGLGDGLVTVESTRLDGVEHHTVRGTHLSMIRNLTDQSSRIPPAVPIISETLEQIIYHRSHDT